MGRAGQVVPACRDRAKCSHKRPSMTTDQLLPLFRGSERLLITLFSGLTIYWGYRLFHHTLPSSSEIAAGKGDFSLKLKRVGPGALFALFGASVMAINLSSPLTTGHPTDLPHGQGSYSYQTGGTGIGPTSDMASRRIRAINVLVATHGKGSAQFSTERVTDAAAEMELLKWELLDDITGRGSADRYRRLEQSLSAPEKAAVLSEEDATFMRLVEDLTRATF